MYTPEEIARVSCRKRKRQGDSCTHHIPGFTRDTIAWLAHLRFVGSYDYPPFPAFNRASREVGAKDSWTEFVVNYGLED